MLVFFISWYDFECVLGIFCLLLCFVILVFKNKRYLGFDGYFSMIVLDWFIRGVNFVFLDLN